MVKIQECLMIGPNQGAKICMRASNDSLPTRDMDDKDRYLANMYWHVSSSFDQGVSNSAYSFKQVDIVAFGKGYTIKIPFITN